MGKLLVTRLRRSRSLLDMAMLYASKAGAIIVGIAILPQFNRLLGAQQFGVVAVVLSFQALLLILDLGVSTLVSRDIAATDREHASEYQVWHAGEQVITWLYAVLLPLVLIGGHFFGSALSSLDLAIIMILFWSLTVQNIGQAAMLAKRRYVAAGGVQVVGVLLRGGITLLALVWLGANITVFLLAQTVCAVLHMAATRLCCRHMLSIVGGVSQTSVRRCFQMVRRGKSLMLFGLAGAAVMQLDKILVSLFVSPAGMAPYYLSTTLCMTPITALAGPVTQFFQPKLVGAITAHDADATRNILKRFASLLVLVTIVPTVILWLLREPVIGAWLRHASGSQMVVHYTAILLPGVAIGAFGYLPYVVLVARQDFVFQARMSTVLTIVTLTSATIAAWAGSVLAVCWVYAAYHSASTLISFSRCIWLERNQPVRCVTDAAKWVLLLSILIVLPLALIVTGYRFFSI
ncbi:lipopolysaccharide biosynthesis protein [Pandoraea fibrosis]|uniref:lipopolysaccharide biosynthesis protein n=1 Tax=Pandoraea fibrosis TaxID=1891094 RepID=UPI0017831BF1|nr:oligosaccharide flippase family protein [Pandoraea fibrosis]